MASSHAPASASPTQGPIVEVAGESRLVGSVCSVCGTHEFPVQAACARCSGPMEPTELPSIGEVWTWTVQRTRPKRLATSEEFEPFALGYVDLGPLKVAARFANRDVAAWRIGDRVRLVVPPDGADDGPPYWFEPDVRS
jgi:uncharacterized OB-fold protein